MPDPQTPPARPKRIQRQRTKGWKMPAGAVYVGRPTRWGNPYRLDAYKFEHADGTPKPFDSAAAREMAVRDFEMWLEVTPRGEAMAKAAREELRGKTLVCWCRPGVPCHADVLLVLANR